MRILTALLATTIIGCASQPSSLLPSHVSSTKYSNSTCNQIAVEREETQARVDVLHASLQKKANLDMVQLGAGLLLFWPALLLLEFGDGAEAAEYQRLSGELKAMGSCRHDSRA